MDPAEHARAHHQAYWARLRYARRVALFARLMIGVTVIWSAVFGIFTFGVAVRAAGPLGVVINLAIAAFDFTMAVTTALQWPPWPKPDPRMPPP